MFGSNHLGFYSQKGWQLLSSGVDKKVIRHINENLSGFFSSDESDEE